MTDKHQFHAYKLAENIIKTSFHAFDEQTKLKTKQHILDTIGVALAGSVSLETKIITDSVCSESSGQASIWGTSRSTDIKTAALINGISSHALELDDSGGCDHSGAVVIPAALAVLSEISHPVSGQQLMNAIILGYEIGRRVLEATGSYESHNNQGWHSTGTCGVFGAATTAALLLNLNIQQLCAALSIAASFASGTWAFIHDGSQTKKLHAGRAAEGGVLAAKLAAKGFIGPKAIFEKDTWGSFLSCFNPENSDPTLLTNEFGEFWRINRCSIKPYATCRGTHSAVDALRQIMDEHDVLATDIEKISVRISQFQFGMCGGKKIQSRAEAQMSIAYALSAWLEFNAVGLNELEIQAWQGSWFNQWFSKIEFSVDEQMADDAEPEIELTTVKGLSIAKTVLWPLGSPQYPLRQTEIMGKYQAMAMVCLSETQTNAIADLIMSLDQQIDVRILPYFLAPNNEDIVMMSLNHVRKMS